MREQITINERAINLFVVYQFLKRLTKPFRKWDAYRTGVIDESGNILVKKSDRSPKQKKSFQTIDLMILKLKKLLEKVPFGKSRIASYAAALWLIKEQKSLELYSDDDILYEDFYDYYDDLISNERNLNELKHIMIRERSYLAEKTCEDEDIEEEIPANSVNTGKHVAGLKEPIINIKKKKKKKRLKSFYEFV